MNDLMKGLEGLEGEVEEENTVIEGDEDAIKDAVLEVVEDETEVIEMEGEVEDMEEANDDFEESYEHLTNLQDAIDQYGLCKPMAAVMGKNYHSLAAAGIVPSFESLNDLPVKGSVSMEASKTIGSRLKAAWEAVKRFLANLWAKLKEMFNRFIALFQKYDTILKGLQSKLKEAKFDDKKLKAKEITTLKQGDLIKFAESTGKLYESVKKSEGFTKDITSFLHEAESFINSGASKDKVEDAIKKIEAKYSSFCNGLVADKKLNGVEVKKSGEVYTIVSSNPLIMKSAKKQKMYAAGWTGKNITDAITEALVLVIAIKGIQGEIGLLDASFAACEKSISAIIRMAGKNGDDEKSAGVITTYEKSLKVGKAILMGKKTAMTRTILNMNYAIKATIIAARASLSCLE